MDYSLLKELISLTEAFQSEQASDKLTDFLIWANNKVFVDSKSSEPDVHEELMLAFRIMYLNKELKKQTKSVLSESDLSSIDEYSFLLHLRYQSSFRKMEIVDLHNLEAPTGIEVIKRLLKNGLIDEFADQEDKRAKRIQINQKGRSELERIEPRITEIFSQFTEVLSLNEKIQMAGILDKLIS
jgi:DNA-binding MarR family transcriptional regulator